MQWPLGCFQNPNSENISCGFIVAHIYLSLQTYSYIFILKGRIYIYSFIKQSYFVDRSQVAVSISKGRVYLYGTGVALQCSLYILHFF